MSDVNTWVGYFSLSLIMIFGILFMAGMIGSFALATRLLVAGALLAYIILRLVTLHLLSRRHRTDKPPETGNNYRERSYDR